MSQTRLFTDAELEEMGARTVDLIGQAIDAGDREKARKLSKRMYNEGLLVHDILVDWVTALLSFIGTQYGDDILYESLEESIGKQVSSMLDADEKADIRQRIQRFIFLLRGHCQPLEITEDDEKIIVKLKPCGSSGRQIMAGKYEPPLNFLKVKKPQPMTSWKEDLPVYCCHDHFITNAHIARGFAPVVLVNASEKPGVEPCEILLYKDPGAVPPEACTRAGI